MPPLSAVIIAQDNAATIADSVRALSWCDEIVVVDGGSRDGTPEICRELGCRVIRHEFAGFGQQKRFAVEQARHDWVLSVDSDEIVSPELAAEIRARLARDSDRFAGFKVPISLVFLGRVLRHGGEYGKRHLRLFDRRRGSFNLAEVHEAVEVQGPVGVLEHHIRHASYRDVEHYFEKFNRYTTSAARTADQAGSHVSRWFIALRLPATFLHLYFIRGLIWDGYPGFVWALFSAFYATVKAIKLEELRSATPPGCTQIANQPASDASQPRHPGRASIAPAAPPVEDGR